MVKTLEVNVLEDSKRLVRDTSKIYLRLKRLQDIVLSATVLLIFFPLMLLTSLLILLDSPGASPIFTQLRVGRDGKLFKFYKFRSMHPDAERQKDALLPFNEMDGPVFKIKEDPRITRFGKFLRKTCIDELPQLWNVLRGEMSIVGPRPGLPDEAAKYDQLAACRLLIKPGLTCYWQTKLCRNQLSFEEWMRMDLQYIKERCFLTDWKIMITTLGTILSMTGE